MRISAHSIGVCAAELLRQPADLLVQGNTSKGIFLKHPSKKIIFLSREQFKGPYSILLRLSLPEINIEGSQWKTGDGTLSAGDELAIQWSEAEIWQAPIRKSTVSTHPDSSVSHEVGRLAWDAGRIDHPVRWLAGEGASEDRWTDVYHAIEHLDRAELKAALSRVCGYGRGLTPSGDDFILGMTLAAQRYPELNAGMDWLLNGEDALKLTARTTLISSNLIEAAAKGQADERLISAFDGFVDGNMSAGEIFAVLSTWGNSSGLDAFCGLVSYFRLLR